MSDSDKMRAEFEAVVRREGWSVRKSKGDPSEYWSEDTGVWWQWWQVAYQTGRKAEREAMQKEALQQLVDEAQKLDMGY